MITGKKPISRNEKRKLQEKNEIIKKINFNHDGK